MTYAICGTCKITEENKASSRKCAVCQNYLCFSMATDNRTVCTTCILSNLHQLDKIFVRGKAESGNWIDPGTLCEIKTCKHCGEPELPMRCGNIIGCYKSPETTSAPNVTRLTYTQFAERLQQFKK